MPKTAPTALIDISGVPLLPDEDYIELTEMQKGYNGRFKRLEVMSHELDANEDIWGKKEEQTPVVYLQEVEGCGYDVYNLTPDQAEFLGNVLIRHAKAVKESFAGPSYDI